MIWNCKLGRATFVFSFISPSSFVPQLVAQFSFHHLLLFSVSFLFQQLYRIQIIPFHITERFSLIFSIFICGFIHRLFVRNNSLKYPPPPRFFNRSSSMAKPFFIYSSSIVQIWCCTKYISYFHLCNFN